MKKSRLAVASLIIFFAAALSVVTKADEEEGSYFYCTSSSCPGEARCSGSFYVSGGTCQVTCYNWYGGYMYVPNGTADCRPMEN